MEETLNWSEELFDSPDEENIQTIVPQFKWTRKSFDSSTDEEEDNVVNQIVPRLRKSRSILVSTHSARHDV